MVEAIAEHDPHGDYDDYLQYLKSESKQYFRRTDVPIAGDEIQTIGEQICCEAIDMLGEPFIYPNPGWHAGNCKWCDFRLPCMATNDGSDVNWILKERYFVRD
jgi:hypothetical protein